MKTSSMTGGIVMLAILVAMLGLPIAVGHFTLAAAPVAAETVHAQAAEGAVAN